MEHHLSHIPWKFKEIFFEHSKSFRAYLVNGKGKTPNYSSLEWVSLLSRVAGEEYFQVFQNIENLDQYVKQFSKDFQIDAHPTPVMLRWDESLDLIDIETIQFEIKDIWEAIESWYQTILKPLEYIVSSEISFAISDKNFVVANSLGNFSKDSLLYTTVFVKLVWEKWEVKEEIYEKITGTNILNTLTKENINQLFEKASQTLLVQLDSHQGPDGKMDVIIGNEAGGTIIHEAVGHGLEADLQNSSVYKGKIGQKVASALVTIIDNPTIVNERGHYRVDHEGTPAQSTVLIENGILVSYLHNAKTSEKFSVPSTWHGRREHYGYKTMVRMGNTYLMPWNDTKENLISRVKNGIYVSRMGWGQVNTTTWEFVFRVQNWFLIENGVQTRQIRGATISGNGPEMLNEIYGICDDLQFFDWGTCGKWQAMPVSDATPTILTRLKVSSIW